MDFDTHRDDEKKPDLHEMNSQELRKELHVARVRIQLAQTFVDLVLYAYDALLSHSINYRNLPEWKDRTLMDRAAKEELSLGQSSMIEWMRRVKHGIRAAIARKGMRQV